MEEILGHRKQILLLEKMQEKEEIPHAFLFSGQEKLGKKKIAIFFAKKILRTENIFSHPDFLFVSPEKEIISIEKIRELNWKISLKPFLAEFKIAILDSADRMTQEAQNALLKSLEEPKGKSILILISAFPEILLPTIRSRCQEIKFFPVKKEEIEEFLKRKNFGKEEIKEMVKLAKGRPGIIFDFLENPQKFIRFKKIEEKLKKFQKMSIFEKFKFLKETDKEVFLEALLNYFREKIFDPIEGKNAISILKLISDFYFMNKILKIEAERAIEIFALKV